MKSMTTVVAATLSVLALTVVTAGAAENFKKLPGSQISAKFAGMELTDEAHWGDVYNRDGTITTFSMGHKSPGKWRVQKDQLCLDRGKEPGSGCFDVWISGKNVELRTPGSATDMPLEGVLQKPTDR